MPDEPKKEDPDKLKIDIIKARIEEYDRNFLSLRDLEWRMALQFLSGYIAIGIAYHQLRPKDGASDLLFWGAGALTMLLFCCFVFFRLCIHQRLTWARDRRVEFSQMLHEVRAETKNPKENDYNLFGKNWYALATQLAVHTLATATVIAFIIATRDGGPVR